MISPRRALQHPHAPCVFGALTALIIWYAWALNRLPVIQDEAAYLLQARLFAHGHWAAAAPVLPEFFEQLYVLVTPVLASKYPPGHSLLLALGALVGRPRLSVILLNGITGGVLFALARRVGGAAVAVLTWLVWISAFPVIYFHAMYLSEVTTSAAWLVAWWCLLQWHEMGRRRDIIGIAIAVGWVAITRPLTAVALALPIAAIVLYDVRRRHAWRDLVIALAIGTAIVAILPIWSFETTGSLTPTPLALYTQQYIPFDQLGFGVDTTHPLRSLPSDLALNARAFAEEHRAHTIAALPVIAERRLAAIGRDVWYDWRVWLIPFALAALVGLPAAGWFAIAGIAVHVTLYLLYAHPAFWSLYYLESEPVLYFLTALGVVRVARWLAARAHRPVVGSVAIGVASIAFAMSAFSTVPAVRAQIAADHAYFERFEATVARIHDAQAIVFVRYARDHNDNLSLVRNTSDPASARVWIAFDRGSDNARLLRAAPSRVPYLFDEATWTLTPLNATP